mmetsp:Transcript_29266/g.28403  ORF Transcript_29266/g.28403 Transcript_29266/m.28403 type:complete len:255 (+) Transcript_29266:1461-2225(+)
MTHHNDPIELSSSNDVVGNLHVWTEISLHVSAYSHCSHWVIEHLSLEIPSVNVDYHVPIHDNVTGGLDLHSERHEVKENIVIQMNVLRVSDMETPAQTMMDGGARDDAFSVDGSFKPQGRLHGVVLGAVVDLHIVQDRLPSSVGLVSLSEVTGNHLAAPSFDVFSLNSDVPVHQEDLSSQVHSIEISFSAQRGSIVVASEVSIQHGHTRDRVIRCNDGMVGFIEHHVCWGKAYQVSCYPVKVRLQVDSIRAWIR